MDQCKCGRDLSLMRKNPHNLRQHLMRCNKSDQVNINQMNPTQMSITNFLTKQSIK
jgi:hypothetical protein